MSYGTLDRGTRKGRLWWSFLLLLPLSTACYSYAPVATTPPAPGALVRVDVTDRGRLALGEVVGPGVVHIGGNVLESTDTTVVLAVTSVQHLDLGVPVRWNGDRVVIERSLISDYRERRISTTRSIVFGAAVAAVTVAVSTIAITGSGSGPGSDKPDGDGGSSSNLIPAVFSLLSFIRF